MAPLSRSHLFILTAVLAVCLAAPAVAQQPVTWTEVVNATVTGTTLQKVAGWDGVDDAGGASVERLTDGDGYIEFAIGETNTILFAGLSRPNATTAWHEIDFALRFNGGGWADVIENGAYQGGDTPYAAGDRFRVAVVNGRVRYSKNGQFIMESAAPPAYPLRLDVSLLTMGATVNDAMVGVTEPPPSGEGFFETAGSDALRPRYTSAEIASFLPAGGVAGPFTFPAPYNTKAIRLTDASICSGGRDCVWYVGYSYWRNINNHTGSPHLYVMLGTDPNRGGAGPMLLRFNKTTDALENLGPLFDASSPYYYETAEGWYFSAQFPTRLYTTRVGSTQLRRFDVELRVFESDPAMDIGACPRPRICPRAAAFITQAHSSDDDLVHSATVQSADWQRLGCVVYRADTGRFRFYGPPRGSALDECHLDKSGRWLMLLETTDAGSRRNRVVDLSTGRIVTIDDVQGALGHLDMGFGYAVGADTFEPQRPNATIRLDFPVLNTTRPIGPIVHFNKRWDIAAANHIAHGNAQRAPSGRPYACGSNASRVSDMADEIICFYADGATNPDGTLDVLVLGQVMTDLDAAGGHDIYGDDYSQLPKGNLDVTGSYFLFTTNFGSDRLDAVLLKVPAERLNASPAALTQACRSFRPYCRPTP